MKEGHIEWLSCHFERFGAHHRVNSWILLPTLPGFRAWAYTTGRGVVGPVSARPAVWAEDCPFSETQRAHRSRTLHKADFIKLSNTFVARSIPALLVVAGLTAAGYGQCLSDKLTSTSPEDFGGFGRSVAVSGSYAIVGADEENIGQLSDCGAAFIYVKGAIGWTLESTVFASDRATGDGFGSAVAISGGLAVAGSPLEVAGGRSYVLPRSANGVWATGPFVGKGNNVAVRNGRLLIAGVANGVEVVEEHHTVTINNIGVWVSGETYSCPDGVSANNAFGQGIGWDGQNIIIGAPSVDFFGLANPGAAYAFDGQDAVADLCANAITLGVESVTGCTKGANREGQTACGSFGFAPDVFYSFRPT